MEWRKVMDSKVIISYLGSHGIQLILFFLLGLAVAAGVTVLFYDKTGQDFFKHQFIERNKRFVLTMVSKKIFAWWIGTFAFFWGKLPPEFWVLLTGLVFGLDVWQKVIGLDPSLKKGGAEIGK
jgi:hypothetical protein